MYLPPNKGQIYGDKARYGSSGRGKEVRCSSDFGKRARSEERLRIDDLEIYLHARIQAPTHVKNK